MFDRLHMKNVQQYLRLLIDTPLKCPIGNVTFEPGWYNSLFRIFFAFPKNMLKIFGNRKD